MKRYWTHIIMSDNGERWEGDVMIADEVDAAIIRLRNALGRIMEVDAGSLIGSHYRDTIIDIAREALAEKEGGCTPTQT